MKLPTNISEHSYSMHGKRRAKVGSITKYRRSRETLVQWRIQAKIGQGLYTPILGVVGVVGVVSMKVGFMR